MKKIQDTDLAVHGTKIPVQKTQNQDVRNGIKYNLRHVHHIVKEERPVTAAERIEKSSGDRYREVFKLRTAKLSGSAVQTKQLKEIRESVEIEDIKRLLRLLGEGKSGDGRGNLVTTVDANKIYREFFQVHYDFLRNLLEESS